MVTGKKNKYERKKLAPLQQLDLALESLSDHSDTWLTLENVTSFVSLNSEDDAEFHVFDILQKLVKDEYAKQFIIDGEEPRYAITFDGHYWLSTGGYIGNDKRIKSKENQLLFIQIVIAITGAIAAIYYVIEIYKYFACQY